MERLPVPDDKQATPVRLAHKGEAVFNGIAGLDERWVNDLLGGVPPDSAQSPVSAVTTICRTMREN